MTTALDICTGALKLTGVLGVGRTAAAEDINDAFATLVRMLNLWQSRRWLVPSLAEVVFPATGALSYSVGIGGDINVLRPDNVEDAFVRLLTGSAAVDYPLQVIDAREDYNSISIKALKAWPSAVYYLPSVPLGQLFIWPVPNATYEIHIFIKAVLANFATLTSPLTLPAEYEEAILYNLAARLAIAYGLPARPDIAALAMAAENTIRNANAQIATLEVHPDLQSGRNGMTLGQFLGGWVP